MRSARGVQARLKAIRAVTQSLEIADSKDPEKTRAEKADAYTRRYATPYMAAEAGFIDEVIRAQDTRSRVIRAFEFLQGKKKPRWEKKHGIMPV